MVNIILNWRFYFMKEKILILEDEIGIRSFVSINLKEKAMR